MNKAMIENMTVPEITHYIQSNDVPYDLLQVCVNHLLTMIPQDPEADREAAYNEGRKDAERAFRDDLDRIQDKAYDEGYDNGREAGYDNGYSNGYEVGLAAGGEEER